jgi:hypothetical protein
MNFRELGEGEVPGTLVLGTPVHNVVVGTLEILIILIVIGLVAYVVWRLVSRPRRLVSVSARGYAGPAWGLPRTLLPRHLVNRRRGPRGRR